MASERLHVLRDLAACIEGHWGIRRSQLMDERLRQGHVGGRTGSRHSNRTAISERRSTVSPTEGQAICARALFVKSILRDDLPAVVSLLLAPLGATATAHRTASFDLEWPVQGTEAGLVDAILIVDGIPAAG